MSQVTIQRGSGGGSGSVSFPITVPQGGTGVTSLTSNGVLYGNGTGVVLVTAQGPANSVLTANAGAPSFSATPTLNGLTLAVTPLGVTSGGTSFASYTKGDLLAASAGTTLVKLAVGTSQYSLIADSAATSGLSYRRIYFEREGTSNHGFGPSAMSGGATITGFINLAFGFNTLAALTGGFFNVATGYSSLAAVTNGTDNTAYGFNCGAAITTGIGNSAFGSGALITLVTASNCLAMGKDALRLCTGGNNTGIGTSAGAVLTTAIDSMLLGYNAGVGITTGSGNLAVGVGSCANVTTGENHVHIGFNSGLNTTTQRNRSIALGADAKVDGDNSIALGYGTRALAAGAIAFGRDSSDSSVSTSVQDQIAMGTSLHQIKIGDYYTWAGQARVSTQFDKTNTTLANITGLTVNVKSGKSYYFKSVLFVDANATGGSKFAIAGTATATAIIYEITLTDDTTKANTITSRQTTLGGSAGQAGTTAGLCVIQGLITVNAAGTLTVQFAQNAASGTSSVLVGSNFEVQSVA